VPEKLDFKNPASTASLIFETERKILLVQRKHEPFAGKWTLPGGFLNCDQETLEQAAMREFLEETNLYITELEFFCVNSDPKRDPRGHVIDHVYIIKHCYGKPEARDDAARLKFFHITELPELAFDHGQVLEKFCIRFKDVEREYFDFDIDT
jgi:8-oxo-dGTP diphosphatase